MWPAGDELVDKPASRAAAHTAHMSAALRALNLVQAEAGGGGGGPSCGGTPPRERGYEDIIRIAAHKK
jgi:hypothetical protein